MSGDDDRRRAANERMRDRIADENKRRPTGGEVVGLDGKPIGKPGQRLTPREIEKAAESLSHRTEAEAKRGRRAPPRDVKPAFSLEKAQEELSPEKVREEYLNSEFGEDDRGRV